MFRAIRARAFDPSAVGEQGIIGAVRNPACRVRLCEMTGAEWEQRALYGRDVNRGQTIVSMRWNRVSIKPHTTRIDPHVKAYAKRLGYDLAGRSLDMSDCWVNVMPAGVVHSLHLHPGSVISGTYYVAVPDGAGPIVYEDPRLGFLMAAPLALKLEEGAESRAPIAVVVIWPSG